MESPVSNQSTPLVDTEQFIAWHAPEGIHTERPVIWYISFILVAISLLAVAIFILRDIMFIILIPVMAVAIFVLTLKQPRTINYAISPKGIYIADRLYGFGEFRAFGLAEDRGQHMAVLLPVKRFSPGITLYFSEAEGEAIVDMLGSRLPMQELKTDLLEKFIRFIKL